MDPLAFVSWQFVLFSLGIFAITYIIRMIVEYFFPGSVKARFWTELALPLLPIFIGGGLSVAMKAYPFTTGLTTTGDHFLFGIVSGLISGVVYKVTKGMLLNQIQSVLSTLVPPPAPPPPLPPGTLTSTITSTTTTAAAPPLPPGVMGSPIADEKLIIEKTINQTPPKS